MIRLKSLLTEQQRVNDRRKSTIQKYVEAAIYVIDFGLEIFKTEGLQRDDGEDPARYINQLEQTKTKLSDAAKKVLNDMNYDNINQLDRARDYYIYVFSDLMEYNDYASRDIERITAEMDRPTNDLIRYYRDTLYSGNLNQKIMSPKEAMLLRRINKAIPPIYTELPKFRNAFLNHEYYDSSRHGSAAPDTPDDQELKSAGYKLVWPGKINLPNGIYAAVVDGRIVTSYKDIMSSDPDIYDKPKVEGNKFKNTGYAYTIQSGFRCGGSCSFYIDLVNGQVKSNKIPPIKIYFSSAKGSEPEFSPADQ
jgi:hypothetical protein